MITRLARAVGDRLRRGLERDRPGEGERVPSGPSTVSVIARCSIIEKGFVMHCKRDAESGDWSAVGTAALSEERTKRGGYGHADIGAASIGAGYPGCPHCGALDYVKCLHRPYYVLGRPCAQVSCWDGEQSVVTCSWCTNPGAVGGTVDSVGSSLDV
jgi:hypothetical protein